MLQTFVHNHRNEIRESSIAFLSVMASAWFYWALFVLFSFFLTISDSYIDILFRISGIALLPSLFAASQAWYKTPRSGTLNNVYYTAESYSSTQSTEYEEDVFII